MLATSAMIRAATIMPQPVSVNSRGACADDRREFALELIDPALNSRIRAT